MLGHQVGVRVGRGLVDAAPRPAGQLAGGLRRPLDDRRDLVERHGEHVVQHERQPLGRRQGVQHHEQRHSHRVGQHRLVLGIDFADRIDDGIRHLGDEFFGGPRPAAAQRVQADPCHHCGQPGVEVGYLAGILAVAAAQPQPGLLHGVLSVVDRAQHAVGHRSQMRPGRLETCCQVSVRLPGHRPPASGSAHTLPSLKPEAPMPNARLNRPRRLPSVMMWVSPTS